MQGKYGASLMAAVCSLAVAGAAFGATKAVFVGTPGPETINGTPSGDAIYGKAVDDSLHGRAGNDVVYGGRGGDVIKGGEGNDVEYGGEGNDRCGWVAEPTPGTAGQETTFCTPWPTTIASTSSTAGPATTSRGSTARRKAST